MNSDQIAGKWKQLKGKAKQQWGKLTDDDLDVINGKRDVLIGKLQERYGYAKEDAQKRADEWLKTINEEPAHAHAGSPSSHGLDPDIDLTSAWKRASRSWRSTQTAAAAGCI